MVETFWKDLCYGASVLRKNHGFTLVAVLTLGIVIGANTATFSVVNAVLLRPLPFAQQERPTVRWKHDLTASHAL
jgi:uncharacterized membrane protein YcjF (UPF0283 family)